MNQVVLKVATKEDMHTVWKMQTKAFSDLYEKYRDHDTSPAVDSFENVMARYQQPWTTYYFIVANDEPVGVIRVIDKKDGSRTNTRFRELGSGYNTAGEGKSAFV